MEPWYKPYEERTEEDHLAEAAEQSGRAAAFMAADPRLGFVGAYVQAGDAMGYDYATWRVAQGDDPEKASVWVGSYARMRFALLHYPKPLLYAELPSLWRGADPDDSDPEFLAMWYAAWEANGREPLHDGSPLGYGDPDDMYHRLTVYRGQDPSPAGTRPKGNGIAWTLDKRTANKFANGAATRQHDRGGVILRGTVKRRYVLGYMTGRGEEELIINPDRVEAVVEQPATPWEKKQERFGEA